MSFIRVKLVFIFSLIVLSSCGTHSVKLEKYQPDWVDSAFQANQGVILSSQLHIAGRNETRELIFDRALVELSKEQFGTSISLNSVVQKTTSVNNENVQQNFQQVDYSELISANKSAKVKARIKAEWLDVKLQKLYLWVVPVQ
ncbi:MAG: hypothetical protein GW882_10905 [Thiomicrospira sp.]|nr:hypothetical protein [Thiomicrospira sp.]OIP96337.1 MAG: hypothetical protein AUK56_02520 [Thiomicrospira sp. CG2_30_44_34]